MTGPPTEPVLSSHDVLELAREFASLPLGHPAGEQRCKEIIRRILGTGSYKAGLNAARFFSYLPDADSSRGRFMRLLEQYAAENRAWISRGNAARIVEELICDLHSRHGLGDEWEAIDGEMQDEIRARWVEIVEGEW
jgi:hypothetical protein